MKENNGPASSISFEEIQEIGEREKLIHHVAMATRSGVRLFSVALEYRHYFPCTPKNDEFFLFTVSWRGLIWLIVSVPEGEREIANKVAEQVGLRVANGVPFFFTDPGTGIQACGAMRPNNDDEEIVNEWFPLNDERTFTLEGKYDPEVGFEGWKKSEDEVISEIFRRHELERGCVN